MNTTSIAAYKPTFLDNLTPSRWEINGVAVTDQSDFSPLLPTNNTELPRDERKKADVFAPHIVLDEEAW